MVSAITLLLLLTPSSPAHMAEVAEASTAATRHQRPIKEKATAMSFEEMVTIVKILERKEYDGRLANYPKPNTYAANMTYNVPRKWRNPSRGGTIAGLVD